MSGCNQAEPFDVVVIGLGCVGSAAICHLASQTEAIRLLAIGPAEPVLDDFAAADAINLKPDRHTFAEHYDEGRITRQTAPDRTWARVGQAALARYSAVQNRSKITFFSPRGCLSIAYGQRHPNLVACLEYSREVKHEQSALPGSGREDAGIVMLSPDNLKKKFPFMNLGDDAWAVWEPRMAGCISPRRQIQAHLKLAEQEGDVSVVKDVVIEVKRIETVQNGMEKGVAAFEIVCEKHGEGLKAGDFAPSVVHLEGFAKEMVPQTGSFRARKVLVTTGGFTNFGSLLGDPNVHVDLFLTSHTTVLGEVSEAEAHRLHQMPSYLIFDHQHEYGLPPIQYPNGKYYIKLGHDPAGGRELKTEADVSQWYRNGGDDAIITYLQEALQQILPSTPFLSWNSRTCVISKTPTGYPYIGMISDGLGIAVGLNGMGAKGADEWGRLAAQVILGKGLDPEDTQRFKPRLRRA